MIIQLITTENVFTIDYSRLSIAADGLLHEHLAYLTSLVDRFLLPKHWHSMFGNI